MCNCVAQGVAKWQEIRKRLPSPQARNYIEIEIILHQKRMGACNNDQKCMEKGENQNLTTPLFLKKIDSYKGIP